MDSEAHRTHRLEATCSEGDLHYRLLILSFSKPVYIERVPLSDIEVVKNILLVEK